MLGVCQNVILTYVYTYINLDYHIITWTFVIDFLWIITFKFDNVLHEVPKYGIAYTHQ